MEFVSVSMGACELFPIPLLYYLCLNSQEMASLAIINIPGSILSTSEAWRMACPHNLTSTSRIKGPGQKNGDRN